MCPRFACVNPLSARILLRPSARRLAARISETASSSLHRHVEDLALDSRPALSFQDAHPATGELDHTLSQPLDGLLAPMVPAAPDGASAWWEALGARVGLGTFTVLRPVTIAAGLGLDIDAPGGHMILEVRDGEVEMAIVADGELVMAHHSAASTPSGVAAHIRSAMLLVDPDVEWDISGTGIHAIGAGVSTSWFRQLAAELGVPIVVSDAVRYVLLAGARRTLDLLDPVVARGELGFGQMRAVPTPGGTESPRPG